MTSEYDQLQDTIRIVEACLLAGKPERIVPRLQQGRSAQDVEAELLEEAARSPERTAVGAGCRRIDQRPVGRGGRAKVPDPERPRLIGDDRRRHVADHPKRLLKATLHTPSSLALGKHAPAVVLRPEEVAQAKDGGGSERASVQRRVHSRVCR